MNLNDIVNNFQNKSNYYGDFKNFEGEINAYRNKIQPMTDKQGNTFRHMAGSAAMTQKYNPILTNILGTAKEVDDYFIKHKNGWDSLGDIKNNFIGSIVGQKNKYMPRKSLYDLIFKDFIK